MKMKYWIYVRLCVAITISEEVIRSVFQECDFDLDILHIGSYNIDITNSGANQYINIVI